MIERLAYLHTSPFPNQEANTINVAHMCAGFSNAGVSTMLIYPSTDQKAKDLFSYYGIRKGTFNYTTFDPKTGKGAVYRNAISSSLIAKRWKANVVYTRKPIFALCSQLLGLRTIIETHEIPRLQKLSSRLTSHAAFKSRKNLSTVAITSSLKADLVSKIGSSIRISVEHDAAPLPNRYLKPAPLKARKCFNLGYVGHLYVGKGMEIIIQLAKSLTECGFHIIGGKTEDVEFWKRKSSGLDNLHFYGYVKPNETHQYRLACDALLLPLGNTVLDSSGKDISNWTSPLKLFEYMSSERPIISSDSNTLREVLTHNENALLCNPDRIEDWQTAIRRLRSDSELSDRLANKAYRDFAEKHTWDARAKRILDTATAIDTEYTISK